MNILIFGNGDEYKVDFPYYLALGLCEENNVTLVSKEGTLRAKLKQPNNLEVVYGNKNNSELESKDFDFCLGIGQSTAPYVAYIYEKKKIKCYCWFLSFPFSLLKGEGFSYDVAHKFQYFVDCTLNHGGFIFNNQIAAKTFQGVYGHSVNVLYEPCYDYFLENQSKDFLFGAFSLKREKGIHVLYQCLENKNFPYVHLCYEHSDALICELQQQWDKRDDILIYCSVSEDRKMELLNQASVVLYPQQIEWAGSRIMAEAMSCKKPCVCFDSPLMRELFEDVPFYSRDTKEFCNNIDKGVGSGYEVKARQLFENKFSIKAAIKKLMEIVNG